ncbi:MAG: adenylosuccinate lyase [Gammaproteobacteria bacterium]|nr:adenylosuccinate lyase [Gammaproteobacteria bacterium]
MSNQNLENISALDGRYQSKLTEIAKHTSEKALFKYRVEVECKWFLCLANNPDIKELPLLKKKQILDVEKIFKEFSLADARRIKEIEEATNHDVKATEYFVKERLTDISGLKNSIEFVHFGCTSEDINNLAYALMLADCRVILISLMDDLINQIIQLASSNEDLSILSRTHGQAASPSTIGKELSVFTTRLTIQRNQLNQVNILGKMNGAVGNFNAHKVAYPDIDWIAESSNFVKTIGLKPNLVTTQIEPHDYIAEYFHVIIRFNQILLDFNQDIWHYIALDYFEQLQIKTETGSSTMPHKINPIDFENSEGNLGIANALLAHIASKLQVSRWQRDLSDSTVLRNIGSAIGHSYLSYKSSIRGIKRLKVNKASIAEDLEANWAVLAEAIQTVMRKYGSIEPYEKLKTLTRGKPLTRESYQQLLNQLEIPEKAQMELSKLRPDNYVGLASTLATLKNTDKV